MRFGSDPEDWDKYQEGDPVWFLYEGGDEQKPGFISRIDRADEELPWAISLASDEHTLEHGEEDWGWYTDEQVEPRYMTFLIQEEPELAGAW